MKPNRPSAAILVVSCDKYADLWPPFFSQLRTNWPDCPFPVYLITNSLIPRFPDVHVISIGADVSWSGNLKKALAQVRENYVLLLLEDLFLVERVDSSKIGMTLDAFHARGGACLKLSPLAQMHHCHGPMIPIPKGQSYRVSTVATYWSVELLRRLLREGENAWEFELNGTTRSESHEGFYSACRPLISIVNGVIRGKWSRRALHRINTLLPERHQTGRGRLTHLQELAYQLALIRSIILQRTPVLRSRRVHSLLHALKCVLSLRRR